MRTCIGINSQTNTNHTEILNHSHTFVPYFHASMRTF